MTTEQNKNTIADISLLQDSSEAVLEPPAMATLVAVALAYGVSDAGNNLALNTIIGRLFTERSEVP